MKKKRRSSNANRRSTRQSKDYRQSHRIKRSYNAFNDDISPGFKTRRYYKRHLRGGDQDQGARQIVTGRVAEVSQHDTPLHRWNNRKEVCKKERAKHRRAYFAFKATGRSNRNDSKRERLTNKRCN